jgi:selenophosphate synthase
MRALLVDPQTSGGLLVAVPEQALDDYLSRVAEAVQIGAVVAREQVDIVLS